MGSPPSPSAEGGSLITGRLVVRTRPPPTLDVFTTPAWAQDRALDGKDRAGSWPGWGLCRARVPVDAVSPLMIQRHCRGHRSRTPLTDGLHQDVGPPLPQRGAGHGGRRGRPFLQPLREAHQVPILSQQGDGRWEGREGGRAGLVLPLPGWGGPLSQSSSTPRCPLTVRGHLAPLPQVGGEGPEATPGVHQLPAASYRRGAKVGAWHPSYPQTRMLRLPPAYGVRNVPPSISPDI